MIYMLEVEGHLEAFASIASLMSVVSCYASRGIPMHIYPLPEGDLNA